MVAWPFSCTGGCVAACCPPWRPSVATSDTGKGAAAAGTRGPIRTRVRDLQCLLPVLGSGAQRRCLRAPVPGRPAGAASCRAPRRGCRPVFSSRPLLLQPAARVCSGRPCREAAPIKVSALYPCLPPPAGPGLGHPASCTRGGGLGGAARAAAGCQPHSAAPPASPSPLGKLRGPPRAAPLQAVGLVLCPRGWELLGAGFGVGGAWGGRQRTHGCRGAQGGCGSWGCAPSLSPWAPVAVGTILELWLCPAGAPGTAGGPGRAGDGAMDVLGCVRPWGLRVPGAAGPCRIPTWHRGCLAASCPPQRGQSNSWGHSCALDRRPQDAQGLATPCRPALAHCAPQQPPGTHHNRRVACPCRSGPPPRPPAPQSPARPVPAVSAGESQP